MCSNELKREAGLFNDPLDVYVLSHVGSEYYFAVQVVTPAIPTT
jgi:hypothetical protein